MRRASLRLAAAVVAGLACVDCAARTFAAHLPAALPDLSGWERASGRAEFDAPRRVVDYELYVSPERRGVYGVARYRIRYAEPSGDARRVSATEKLQWDRDGRDVRRFECVPLGAAAKECAWNELARGTAAFDAELPSLLQIYALHAFLLREREAKGVR